MLRRACASGAAPARALHASAAQQLRVLLQQARALRARQRSGCGARRTQCLTPAPTLARAQDVASVGAAGEVVDVARGYARNCLLPSRLAVPATAAATAAAAASAALRGPAAAEAAPDAESVRARALDDLEEVMRRLTATPLVRRTARGPGTRAHACVPANPSAASDPRHAAPR
jgi:hypothetical protein